MRIVFVTRKFPPSVGGMERFAYDLHGAVAKKATTYLVKWGGSNVWLPLVIPYLALRTFWLVISKRVDLIHVQDGVIAPVGYALSLLVRKPWVIVIHGLDISYENVIFRTINLRCIRRAGRVFCISQAAAEEAVKRGVPAYKIQIIPLGITDDYPIDRPTARKILKKELGIEAQKHKLLLTTGRLVKRKGVAWFVENVMPQLVERLPNVLYLVVGEGEDRRRIEKSIAGKGLQKHVCMLGKVSDELLGALYRGSDIFVMPNVHVPGDIEGFGRVAIEASVCELPVVASGIEGIRDAVADGKNGVLVPPRDAWTFENEILKLADETYRHSFGKKSRRYTIEHYDWGTIAEQYIRGYKKALD